jgi:hypothetical protein
LLKIWWKEREKKTGKRESKRRKGKNMRKMGRKKEKCTQRGQIRDKIV